ncbi:hypothetical protein [Paraburkholderia sp. MM5384-R2]|uniref:hypothetical protein n=1 Tax=Paraburkholderia sp. MM5384-R2 TaxID=2723097 RepID=UPI001609438F|nr:hypothetical protein [Paraburkholderia sp. MM5384-R2]MBB5496718.1 hypothetical protein [Paraburkholderia sp. MM5384-R2]
MAHDWITKQQLDQFKGLQRLYASNQDFDFGWWCAYFWKEARASGGRLDPGDEKLKALFVRVYRDPTLPTMNFGGRKTAGATIVVQQAASWPDTDADKRAVLELALEIGFKDMPGGPATGGIPRGLEVRRYFRNKLRLRTAGGGRLILPIGCRGEGRDFATVREHGGALNRVDLGLNNMGQPWHPFSHAPHKDRMYFRVASGDNCLFSVLSVAETMKLSVGFPLIEDEQIFKFPSALIMHWTRSQLELARANDVLLARVTCTVNGTQRTGVFLATQSYAYSFKVLGDAVHTQDFLENEMGGVQDQCIERGVREVALQDFLFGLKLRRIHLGPTRGHGVIAFIEQVRYQMGGDWHENVERALYAQRHFDSDRQAADAVLDPLEAQIQVGRIEGERLVDGNAVQIQSIDQWALSYEQFRQVIDEPRNQHFGQPVYFGATS